MDKDEAICHVEDVHNVSEDGEDVIRNKVVGTVQMYSHNETVLIPTPSPDPKGDSQLLSYLICSNKLPYRSP